MIKVVTTSTSERPGHIHGNPVLGAGPVRSEDSSVSTTSPTVATTISKCLLLPPPLQRNQKRLQGVTASASDPLDHTRDKATGSPKVGTIASKTMLDTCDDNRDETEAMDRSNDRPFDPRTNRTPALSQDCAESGLDPFGVTKTFPQTKARSVPYYKRSRSTPSSTKRDVRSTTIEEHSVMLDSDLQGLLEYLDGIGDCDESTTVSGCSLSAARQDPIVNMLVINDFNATDLTSRGLPAVMSALSSSQCMSYDDDSSSIDTGIIRDLENKTANPEQFTAEDLIMPPVMARGADHKPSPLLSLAVSETRDDASRHEPSQRSTKSYSIKPSCKEETKPSNLNEAATSNASKGIVAQYTHSSVSENKVSLTGLQDVSVRASQGSLSENHKQGPMLQNTSTISTCVTLETAEGVGQVLPGFSSLSTISSSVFKDDSYVSTSCSDDSEEYGAKSKTSEASNDTSHSEDANKAQLLSQSLTSWTSASVGLSSEWNDMLGNIFVALPKANVEMNSNVDHQDQRNGRSGTCTIYETVCSSFASCWQDCVQPSKDEEVLDNPTVHMVATMDLEGDCANELTNVEAALERGSERACFHGGECTLIADASEKNNSEHLDKESTAMGKVMARRQSTAESARIVTGVDVPAGRNLSTQVDTVLSLDTDAMMQHMAVQTSVDFYVCSNDLTRLCIPDPKDHACLCNDRVDQALSRSMKKHKGGTMTHAFSSLSVNSPSMNSLSARPEGFGEARRERADSVPTLITSMKIVQTTAGDVRASLPPSSQHGNGKRRGFLGMRRKLPSLRRSKINGRSVGSAAKTM
jgi:hypothetical protein